MVMLTLAMAAWAVVVVAHEAVMLIDMLVGQRLAVVVVARLVLAVRVKAALQLMLAVVVVQEDVLLEQAVRLLF
jgi:hypothetical protein